MEPLTHTDVTIRRSKRYYFWQSTYLSVSALLTYSSFIGVVSLQSSINIAEEVGTTCLAVCYGTAMLCNAACTPTILQFFGPKRSLIVADVFYIFYTLANLYPSFPFLIIASVFLGIAQAISWSDFPKFFEYYGKEYSKLAAASQQIEANEDASTRKPKTFNDYVCRFAGRFYSILAVYLVLGNMSSYVILQLVGDLSGGENNGETFNLTIQQNATVFSAVTVRNNITATVDLSSCGSNQCSATDKSPVKASTNDQSFEKYLINNWTLQLSLFLFYAVIQVLGLCIHVFLLKDLIKEANPTPNSSSNDTNNNCKVATSDVSTFNETYTLTSEQEKTRPEKRKVSVVRNIRDTLRHLKDPWQLLILPSNLHLGLVLAFIFGDLTRSFISCVSGVQQVGIMLSVLGVSQMLTGVMLERLGARFGRNLFMGISYGFELVNLLTCLFWPPSANSWVPWFLMVSFGISDGLREPLIGATIIAYFSQKGEVAYSTLGLLTGLGSSLTYLSSRFLCVNVKIYVLLSTYAISAVCYVIAEILRHRLTS